MYTLCFTNDAQKDAQKVAKSNLKEKIQELLEIIKKDPFQNPPPFKKLVGKFQSAYSRRINLQHRLFYQVDTKNKKVKVLRMWTHYGDN